MKTKIQSINLNYSLPGKFMNVEKIHKLGQKSNQNCIIIICYFVGDKWIAPNPFNLEIYQTLLNSTHNLYYIYLKIEDYCDNKNWNY
jgi:hypothetical protein